MQSAAAQTTPPPQTPQSKGWSPERRAKQSAMMRARQIWTRSTGPKTAAGKARSSQNALKSGHDRVLWRLTNHALKAQRLWLNKINALHRVQKNFPQNELLKAHARTLSDEGRTVTIRLAVLLAALELCKNLDFCPDIRQIVNANRGAP
ncbi:MAG: hypothetical protein DI551_05185 [Micavibrio aeruginosavorus]|uniref:Uncharacterized protein n=1 Tax=Micavibrio aeruginosavorus TaxID=349221 RepID=A0A2W5N6M1_9BACT|nr:MAG: hypothetical protein DI551_05185 [Micavibrio aeruginosavorus]